MILVETYLDRSEIAGIGVFASKEISIGEAIWEFTPGIDIVIDPTDIENLPKPAADFIADHAYVDFDGRYVLCSDHGSYINHSDRPNMLNGHAIRPIKKGEEITDDYRTFERDSVIDF